MKRLVLLAALVGGCATVRAPAPVAPIAAGDLSPAIETLASDAFEGRRSGTAGEARTIAYIADRFRAAGLADGARGSTPYLDPFPVDPKTRPLPDERQPGARGQRTFTEAINATRAFTSHNVVGVARGRRPDGRAVVMMAHWDHLGLCRPAGEADRICNGAADNASGVAALIAVAERVARMGLDRDVWFVATGAEEWGLVGASQFAARPPLPLASIVAGFNLDMIAVAPAGAPVALIAAPGSPLGPLVKDSAAALGRAWDGDSEADEYLKRQDGWALAQHGVPIVMAGGAFSDRKRLEAFLAEVYHNPNDEAGRLELGGAVQDSNLHVELIRRAASRRYRPRG